MAIGFSRGEELLRRRFAGNSKKVAGTRRLSGVAHATRELTDTLSKGNLRLAFRNYNWPRIHIDRTGFRRSLKLEVQRPKSEDTLRSRSALL